MTKITLRAARINAGLTQIQVSKALGIAPATLSGWEKNSTKLSFLEAIKLAKLYHIQPDNIFFGSENEFIRSRKAGEN